jgi:hypothetical protein
MDEAPPGRTGIGGSSHIGTFSADPGQNAQVSTRCKALKLHTKLGT